MNKRQRRIIGDYIRVLFDEMGLRDWFFALSTSTSDDHSSNPDPKIECLASCERIDGRKVAYIALNSRFLELSDDDKRSTLAHEILHCHLTDLSGLVERDLIGHLGQTAYDLFTKSFVRALEYAVDGIASEWAKTLPPFPDLD